MAEREPHPVAPAKTTQRRGEMKRESRHPIWSWVIHTPWVLAVIALLSVIAFFGSGAGNPFLRRLIVHRSEAMTGGRAQWDDQAAEKGIACAAAKKRDHRK